MFKAAKKVTNTKTAQVAQKVKLGELIKLFKMTKVAIMSKKK